MRDAIRLASELIKPGVRGYEIDEPVRNYVAEQGYTYYHATGHQIGRMAHDGGLTLGPRNIRYGDRVMGELLPGMCFTLEPCIFDIGSEKPRRDRRRLRLVDRSPVGSICSLS